MSSRVIQRGSAVKTAIRDLSMLDGELNFEGVKVRGIPDCLVPGQRG